MESRDKNAHHRFNEQNARLKAFQCSTVVGSTIPLEAAMASSTAVRFWVWGEPPIFFWEN